MHDITAIVDVILNDYPLPPRGSHGAGHWARVLENGLRIAEINSADREIITLFALFHDSHRVNEERDPDHGLRGAELARSLRGELVHLNDDRFDLLFEACRLHTEGRTKGDRTLLACGAADRLDLGRAGTTPDPRRLGTKAARQLLDGRTSAPSNGTSLRQCSRRGAWKRTSNPLPPNHEVDAHAQRGDRRMAQVRCPYCHEYIDRTEFAAHEAAHRKARPDGQQTDYATLPEEEREHGDLEGVPQVYVHRTCGVATGMPEEIIRSYLKNPYMYMADATFCCGCRKHVPFRDCVDGNRRKSPVLHR